MRHVNRNALVPYSAREMFLLVDDVETYPEFLHWCRNSTVHSRSNSIVEATLELQKGGMSNEFTTRNSREEYSRLGIALIGGPFRILDGGWNFDEIGNSGCKVSLALKFEFESMFVDMMFGTFFEDTCNSLVDAFTKRAAQVYGQRGIS